MASDLVLHYLSMSNIYMLSPIHFEYKGCWVVFYNSIQILKVHCTDPDHMSRSAASDLGLHCVSLPHKKDAMFSGIPLDFPIHIDTIKIWLSITTLVNVKAPVVATTSWWWLISSLCWRTT